MNEPQKYLALALDPIHIGAGGYQLGRVDMSIVRDPATGIPKIPGTSLAGTIRAYAELAKTENEQKFKGLDLNKIFGPREGEGDLYQGMLRFFDAEIVLFPVNSIHGTVWVSTLKSLKYWFKDMDGKESIKLSESNLENKILVLKGLGSRSPVNIGWLLLEVKQQTTDGDQLKLLDSLSFINNLVVVSDKLFHHIVNDHLEVRTSVSIDQKTGAAKRGALFTYEAIPRGTIIGFEIVKDDRRGKTIDGSGVDNLLSDAFNYLKILGVGGMGSRGFGRLEVFHQPTSSSISDAIGGCNG
ncbi:MAG: type III-B CRISPR module RAMP protein Cmr4 [Deltaproteobacteria bacterium]|nr:type III-B CRISPR module RAMP protein Cmr4 [Deltaproteobacteria bacterium]